MIVSTVKFETELSEKEVMDVVESRVDDFRAMPGLLQKYYVKMKEPDHYGGIYIWDSKESLAAYRSSELAATIAKAYRTRGAPTVEVMDLVLTLREDA